jgi:hypothetical protein
MRMIECRVEVSLRFYLGMRRHVSGALAGLCLLALTGCPPGPVPVNSGTSEAVGEILKEVKASVEDMRKTNADFVAALNAKYDAQFKALQFIADRIDSAQYYNLKNPDQNQFTLLVKSELDPAAKVAPPPTVANQQATVDKLQLALSNAEVDKAKLQLQNQQLLTQAANLQGQVQATSAEAEKARVAAQTATVTATANVGKLADKDAEIRIQAAENERQAQLAHDAEASKARIKVATVFMVLGGIAVVGGMVAFFLHVPSIVAGAAGAAGVVAFAFGWLITYIEGLMSQPWFQPVALGLIGLIVVAFGWLGMHVYRERQKAALNEKGFTAVVGALQEAKNDDARLGTTKFAGVAPHISEWTVNDKGQPDDKLRAHIEQTVIAMNLKNPNGNAPVPVQTVAPLQGLPGAQGIPGMPAAEHLVTPPNQPPAQG